MRTRTWKALLCIGALWPGIADVRVRRDGVRPEKADLVLPSGTARLGRAVETARTAGKDKECPEDFKAAEKMKNDAYEIYWSCRTEEGIAKAKEATAKANGLCPMKAAAPAPPLLRHRLSRNLFRLLLRHRRRRRRPPFPFRRARPPWIRGNARP